MAANAATLRQKKEKAERDYDAQITALNKCQAQLSSKADQLQKLSMPEYQTWLSNKKIELASIQQDLQRLKQIRAEARRQFNSWTPQVKEEWLEWPDEEGWWWNYKDDGEGSGMTMHHFEYNHVDEEYRFSNTDKDAEEKAQLGSRWSDYWKFQEEPEVP